jgi:hypothetical protein
MRLAFARYVLPWPIVLVLLSLPLWLTPMPIPFKPLEGADLTRLLGIPFLIALFLERALEVFVNTWRGPDAADLDQTVQNQKQALAKLEALSEVERAGRQQELTTAQADLAAANLALAKYKSGTQRIALWTGLILGLLISAVGIRTLQTFVEPTWGSTSAQSPQVAAFHLVDVLLTGSLLAGGSEGIHKLTQVYTNFMEASAKLAKERGQTNP